MNWKPMDEAPTDGLPFLLGTRSGGIMLELWHWCSDVNAFRGCYSKLKLSRLMKQGPNETFLWARPKAPGPAEQGSLN